MRYFSSLTCALPSGRLFLNKTEKQTKEFYNGSIEKHA